MDGSLLAHWHVPLSPDQLNVNICLDPNSQLIHLIESNRHIAIYRLNGEFIRRWRCENAVSLVIHPRQDLIVVSTHSKILAYRKDGTFLHQYLPQMQIDTPVYLWLMGERGLILALNRFECQITVLDIMSGSSSTFEVGNAFDIPKCIVMDEHNHDIIHAVTHRNIVYSWHL